MHISIYELDAQGRATPGWPASSRMPGYNQMPSLASRRYTTGWPASGRIPGCIQMLGHSRMARLETEAGLQPDAPASSQQPP